MAPYVRLKQSVDVWFRTSQAAGVDIKFRRIPTLHRTRNGDPCAQHMLCTGACGVLGIRLYEAALIFPTAAR